MSINPGCFGAATTFSMDSAICNQCNAKADCEPEALQALERIKGIVRIDDLVKRHRAARAKAMKELKAKDDEAIAAAPPGPIATPTPTKPVARVTPAERVEFEVSEKHARVISHMPTKAQTFATTLCRRGAIQMLRRNAAYGKVVPGIPGWLAISMQMLMDGGFTKASLKERFVSELKWGDGTAYSHISLATSLLTGFEIASEANGKYTLSPTIAVQQ